MVKLKTLAVADYFGRRFAYIGQFCGMGKGLYFRCFFA